MDTGSQIKDSRRLSAVRRDLVNVNDKLNIVDAKIEALNQGLYPVPEKLGEMDSDSTFRAQRIAELEERNKIHSAKLHLLQKEITYVKTENDLLMDHITPRGQAGYHGGGGMGHNEQRGPPPQMAEANNPANFYPDPQQDRKQTPDQRPPHYAGNGQDANAQRTNAPGSPRKGNNLYEQNGKLNNNQQANQRNGREQDKRDFDFEEMQNERRRKIYGYHDSTAINPHLLEQKPKHNKYPWYDHATHPYPGGFLFLRFDDAGYTIADVALKKQQSICRHAGGYLMGFARKERIFVYESVPSKQRNWSVSRKQPYKDVVTTENAMAVFWFTSKGAAEAFVDNTHNNPFREPCFPTASGYEAFYVPLCSPPTKSLNTYLFLEIMDAHRCDPEVMTQFEVDLRSMMEYYFPNSDPMIVSAQTGRVVFKPGQLVTQNSKLFVSRFQSQRDTDEIWKSEEIQKCRKKYGLTGAINAFSISIDLST